MKRVLVWIMVLIFSCAMGAFSSLKVHKAHAATINVHLGESIQAAVAGANDNDIILVDPGAYTEVAPITPTKNNLTIQGSGASVTTISTNNNVFYIGSAVQNLTIKGFTLTTIIPSIGIFCDRGGQQGTATGTISDNIITNNPGANNTFGISLIGGCSFEIKNNTVTQGVDLGIFVNEITATNNIHDNQITHNTVGVFLAAAAANPNNTLVHHNTISDNQYGIFVTNSTASIYNNSINNNIGGLSGGGIATMASTLQIYANKIFQNSAGAGGGIAIIISNAGSNIYNNYISQNSAITTVGGGILSVEDATPIFNNTIVNNTATVGGMGPNSFQPLNFKIQGYPDLEQKINGELKTLSDQFHIDAGEHIGGGAYFTSDVAVSPLFYNNIVWGNTDGVVSAVLDTPILTYNDMQDNFILVPASVKDSVITGNIALDPRLSGYTLQEDSPCIDMGASAGAPSNDIDGTGRPQRNGIDMGAYELAALTPTETITTASTLPDTGAASLQSLLLRMITFQLLSLLL